MLSRSLLFISAVFSSTLVLAAPAPKVLGLICQSDFGVVEMTTNVQKANTLLIFRQTSSLGNMAVISVASVAVAPIMKGALKAMNGVALADASSGAQIRFRVDGSDFQGIARLGVQVRSPKGSFELSSCNSLIETNVSL